MESVTIRSLTSTDWPRVKEIYENGIATGIATFEPSAPSWKDWDSSHLQFSRLVALENQHIMGWAAINPVSGRCVYGGVAEVSVYVETNYRGRGLGKLVFKELTIDSEKNGIWTLQAGVFTENIASLHIHLQAGFRVIGKRERIGRLSNVWKDNLLLEKRSTRVGVI